MKTLYTTYNNFAKRLVMSLIVLMTIGVGSVLGETATFTWGTNPSAYTKESSSFSEGQVTFTGTKGTGSTATRAWDDGLRMYAGGTAEFSVPNGYIITKIEGYTTFNFDNPTGQQSVKFTGLSKATCKNDVIVTYTSSGYTITYETNGGSAVSSTTGTKLPNPLPTTTKSGYTFAGWYINSNLTTAATAGATINADITLYAKWTPTQYTITYNGLEGATHNNPTNYTIESETITFTAPSERVGYNFTGWNPASIAKGSMGNKTVTAQWTEKQLTNYRTSCSDEPIQLATPNVTLTYDCTTATISWDNVANASAYWYQIKKTIDADAGISSVNTTYTRDDLEQGTSYTWSVRAIGDGTTYLDSEGATGTFTTGYTITYETNGGSAVENACGTNLPSPLPTTTQDGYNFLGWYTDVDLTNKATAGADVTKNTTLYAKWEKAKTATSLTWSADSYTATIASENNVFPTLTINPEAIKGSVTYSSSHPEYATIDAAGNIRLLAAGTTTITASYAGDEDYNASSDTYELTVEESTNCRWEEVTDLNDIATGDEVVITMTKGNYVWTILNEKNTSTAPNATDISAKVDGKYLTEVNDKYKWVIEKNNDNLTFYSYTDQTNYLYCINDDNGVRVGTGSAKVFVVDGNYLKNTQTTSPRYIGVSLNTTPYSWRCYTVTTGVIADQTLKFYKKVCLPNNIFRVTYSVGAGDTAPEEQEVVNNTSITLPSITTNLTCVNFVGWTDAASGYTHGTDNLYKAGDSYTVTENVTLHAVYAAGGGYVLVTDVANLAVGDKVIIVATNSNVAMGADRGSNRGQVEVTKDGNTISNIGESQILTLEAGTKSETFAFNTGSGYLYAASSSSNHLKTQATNNDNGSWKIEIDNAGIATIKAQGTYTRNWLRYNDGSDIFSCYASGQSDVSIYREDVAGYTTDPACVTYEVTTCTPTNGTISVDPTTVDPYGSAIVTFAPASGYMLQAVTVSSGTATVGAPSYTTNQISGGTVRITDIQSDIEVCATFVEIPYYKVTFVDMNNGNSTKIVSQSGFGADIMAPTTASDGCDATWTFIGWAPNNSLNGASEIPSGLVTPGGTISGSLITSNDLTYYSVYSNSSDGTPPFSIGKSGTYYFKAITENSDVYYATGEFTGLDRYNTNSTPNIPFLLTYNSVTGKYTIKNTLSDKYLAPDSYDENNLTEQDASYGWDVIQPTLYADKGINAQAKTGEYLFSYTKSDGTSVRYLYCNESYFDSWSRDNSKYALYLEPASEMHYYNASSCTELVTMTFDVPADAELTYENGYPEGYYKDSEKKNVSTFPTLTYEGWTFIGWTAGASYNDQIGDANLDDENSSPNAPSETIYKTGGVSYYLGADVTMYPVFTKFADNEPFDMVNGGDYYIYYIADGDIGTSVDEYGASNRIYAGEYLDYGLKSTQSCATATLFTFTKLSNGKWTIFDNKRSKYLYGVDNNNQIEDRAQTVDGKIKFIKEWSIEVINGNQVNAVSAEGYVLSAYSQDATTGTFKNYDEGSFRNNTSLYHRVYLGTCTERVYSSNPSNKPKITLNGTATVTSTKDQTIRSAKSLTISAVKLAANGTITLTSDNADVYFSTDKTANFSKATKPEAPLTIYADANGKVALTTVYVHYKPTSTSTLGVQTANITATTGTNGQPDYAIATTTTALRNLPAKFVIATKVGATWYALPANMNGATNPEGVVIDVDETNMTAIAPNTTVYTLFPVKTTSTQYDRFADFGDRVRFSAVNNESKGLWATSNGNTINNGAQIASEADGGTTDNTNPSYEWKITTTVVDGNWQYTLQTDQPNNQKYLRYWVGATGAPKWGTYAAGNDQLYFLPVTETEPFDYKVVEWYPTKMLIQTDAAIANPTAKIGDEQFNDITCNNKGSKLYEIAGLPLESNPTKVLTIKFSDGGNNYTNATAIPVIISQSATTVSSASFTTLTKDVYNYADLVVRDGARLTIDGGTHAENTFFNVTIYPTSKISVPSDKKLTVHSLTFFGGIDEIYNGSTYTLNKYGVPELSLKGTLYKSIAKMDYVMRVDLDQMYSLTVPYDVQLADIKYWDGSDIALGTALYVSAYDGEARANQSKKTWIYETDFESKLGAATLKAGVGYTISAELQAGVGNEYSILRMPMNSNIANDATEVEKSVPVTAHGIGTNVTDNHKGWNLVGNPYMASVTGADDDDLVLGYLQETGTGPWEWVNDGIRYVTIPSDDGTYYWQQKFTTTELPPFKNFFVQIGTTGELAFGLGTRQSMPARSTQAAIEKEVEFEILMSNDARQDNTGLLISEEYSPAYEINADLEKMIGSMSVYTIYGGYKLAYNALSPINASEWIPMGYIAPAAGEYTFRLDDVEKIVEQVEHVYVIDYDANNIVDLMTDEYKFTTNKEQNDNRFAINVVLIQDKDNTTTGLDIINGNNIAPIKFIYHDKIYIKSGEVIYDGTGKQVTNINK